MPDRPFVVLTPENPVLLFKKIARARKMQGLRMAKWTNSLKVMACR